jgi:16S rRNA (adenine1518-N6/adenine1519-N6)-dimethyltransferase
LRPSQSELLRRYGVRLDKRLGQHFLVDARVPTRIADLVAELEPDRVVEMASGAGALTFALLERGWPITALEIDARMIALLEEETDGRPVRIEACDLANANFEDFVGEGRTVFAGNLPYQVTSPILFGLLPALRLPSVVGAVVMVQAEVGRRMAAPPGSRTYGVLSVLLQAQLHVRRAFTVKPGAFLPPPEIDSEVLVLTPRPDPVELGVRGTRLVKDLFAERRKQIGGLLRRGRDLDEAALGEMQADLDLDPRQRAETLAAEDFFRLDRWLASRGQRA